MTFYQILQVYKFTFFQEEVFCIEKAPEGERYKSNNSHVGIKVRPHDIPKDYFFQDVKHLQLEITLGRTATYFSSGNVSISWRYQMW